MFEKKHLAGFGSRNLAGALEYDLPIAREQVEVNVFYTAPGNAPEHGSVWAVLDFMDFDLATVNTIKNAIAGMTRLDWNSIHVLTTHNHGAGEPVFAGKLGELAAQAACEAMQNARPALARGTIVAMPEGINYRRRIYVDEFKGMWTTFGGPDFKSKRNAAGFIENAISNLEQESVSYFGYTPSQRPAPDYLPGDPDFFFMEFKAADSGEMLGTISRFAMHATMRHGSGYYAGDYPWHIRNQAILHCGGKAVFMNGPCGDIAPCFPWPDKTTGLEEKYAVSMIETALKHLKNQPFEPLRTACDQESVALPVRKEILKNEVSFDSPLPPMSDLPARKKHLEKSALAHLLFFLHDKHRRGNADYNDQHIVELGCLMLNDYLIAAFPGETFSTTASEIKARFPEQKFVSVTEHGRTAMYIVPEAEYHLGGYEPTCSVTSPQAEAILKEKAYSFFKKFTGQNIL